MDQNNAIELKNVFKSFKVTVEDNEGKRSPLGKLPMKTVQKKVLDDISLNIKKGEILGIIGRNGSGKSTLLSIISKIMEPDSGTVEFNGKIATILELGMGFHPDMSGRENIYLKGELYGFSKKDMDSRIDRIIEYSGIGDYIDNPVRTYSSGMTGRLAFAIMVNVDSDIMVVDEILSIGDTSFSIKAQEHFKRLTKTGKTIIIVSHQLNFLEQICTRIVWIEKGKLIKNGAPKTICSDYTNKINESLEIIQDLANAGVAESQYKLAIKYRDGDCLEQNQKLYVQWIKQAAMQGHAKAQIAYADYLLLSGDRNNAFNYYKQAANKGDNEAKIKVSTLVASNENEISSLLKLYRNVSQNEDPINLFRFADLLLKTALTNADREEAFSFFKKAADKNYPNAQYQIGIMFRDGVGTKRNPVEMEKYLTFAANQGHMGAITTLSDLYLQGKILPKNEQLSFKWTLIAAKLGNAGFMFKVATMYREGTGVGKNPSESEMWFKRFTQSTLFWHYIWAADLCKTGIFESELDTCDCYEQASLTNNPMAVNNLLVSNFSKGQDISPCIEQLKELADLGNVDAIKRYANLYFDGVFVKKDYSIAYDYYKKASTLGDIWCKMRTADMEYDEKYALNEHADASRSYLEMADMANVNAIVNLINIELDKSEFDQSTISKLLKVLENIGNSGNNDALKRLGDYYFDGRIVKKDYSKALEYYEHAATLGNSWCKNRVAEMYRDGKGTKVNLELASKWFVKCLYDVLSGPA